MINIKGRRKNPFKWQGLDKSQIKVIQNNQILVPKNEQRLKTKLTSSQKQVESVSAVPAKDYNKIIDFYTYILASLATSFSRGIPIFSR